MKLIRPPLSEMERTPLGDYIDSLGFTRLRHLELQNFYQLPGQRIDAASLKLTIKRGDDEPPKTFITGPHGESVPYLEVLGLDNFDETSGRPVLGHDNRLDGTAVSNTSLGQPELWLDAETGVLHFLEPRPFAPQFHYDTPFDSLMGAILFRRAVLNGQPGTESAPNFSALLESSCSASPRLCATSGFNNTPSPTMRT